MSEFKNRINTQRATLKLVNSSMQSQEPLFSLTNKAIHRWITSNKISSNDKVVGLLRKISEKLFFLANKSQEQITEEYSELSKHVDVLINELRNELVRSNI